MFLFALPAGALADIVDRRKLLIVVEIAITVGVRDIRVLVVWFDLVTPGNLAALHVPHWRRRRADRAGVAIDRAATRPQAGPASGGGGQQRRYQYQPRGRAGAGRRDHRGWGIAAPFWFNAFSNLGIIAALLWWRPPQRRRRRLPAERFSSAIRTGLRYARNNPHLRATLIRAAAFFLFASAYWALAAAGRAQPDRAAVRRSTAFCWAPSVPAPSAAPSPCRG